MYKFVPNGDTCITCLTLDIHRFMMNKPINQSSIIRVHTCIYSTGVLKNIQLKTLDIISTDIVRLKYVFAISYTN